MAEGLAVMGHMVLGTQNSYPLARYRKCLRALVLLVSFNISPETLIPNLATRQKSYLRAHIHLKIRIYQTKCFLGLFPSLLDSESEFPSQLIHPCAQGASLLYMTPA